MSDGAASRLWQRIRQQFDAEAGHLHRLLFLDDGAVPMTPNDSYVRVWLTELHLAKQVSWGVGRSPVIQASVRLMFGGLSTKRSPHSSSPRLAPGTGSSRTNN